ncbi:MAG TPA: type I-E CRISPR-associated protein Cas6/Cse3/CasE [Gammaproteobacteria bacterium]|nr:type I-E CRISPR-associated protein Cas6/Cse3/CasE [Gammaproteobacteria bacterium]
MYLSRVVLTGEHLHNLYEIHRALWQAFPCDPDQVRDFLFRVEKRETCQVQVLLQSQRMPEDRKKNIRVLATKTFNLSMPEGSFLRFMLIANPVKTIADEQGRLNNKGDVKKCRVPLIKEDEQVEWLKRKLDDAALANGLEIEKQTPVYFRKNHRRGKIQPFAFKGLLQIQDSKLFEDLIRQGIGPAKAFGCGLLSLARA